MTIFSYSQYTIHILWKLRISYCFRKSKPIWILWNWQKSSNSQIYWNKESNVIVHLFCSSIIIEQQARVTLQSMCCSWTSLVYFATTHLVCLMKKHRKHKGAIDLCISPLGISPYSKEYDGTNVVPISLLPFDRPCYSFAIALEQLLNGYIILRF